MIRTVALRRPFLCGVHDLDSGVQGRIHSLVNKILTKILQHYMYAYAKT